MSYFKKEEEDDNDNKMEDGNDNVEPSILLKDISEFKNNHSFSGLESFLLNIMMFDEKIVPKLNIVLMDK